MATRQIYKALAGQEDLALGLGTVTQNRNFSDLAITQINLPFIFQTVLEIKALDTTRYQFVQLNSDGYPILYYYDSESSAEDNDVSVLMPDSGA